MSSIESDVLLARAHSKQKQPDEATALLRRAFLAYRTNPWPDPETMREAFEVTIEVARTSPDRARILEDAISRPFAALQHENTRRFTRVAITPLFNQCGARTLDALAALEPYPMWNRQILTIRANCYALARPALAEKAWADLAQYDEAESATVVR